MRALRCGGIPARDLAFQSVETPIPPTPSEGRKEDPWPLGRPPTPSSFHCWLGYHGTPGPAPPSWNPPRTPASLLIMLRRRFPHRFSFNKGSRLAFMDVQRIMFIPNLIVGLLAFASFFNFETRKCVSFYSNTERILVPKLLRVVFYLLL